MPLRESLRRLADGIRGGVPGRMGLRTVAVGIVSRTWDAVLPGEGSPTVTTYRVLNDGYNPKVEEVSSRDVMASGGLYQAGDFRIGPITPFYVTGGTEPSDLDPVVPPSAFNDTSREVFVVLKTAPEEGAQLIWCRRVATDNDAANFRRILVARRTADQIDVDTSFLDP